jgi:type I restriction enzyme, S subunit
VIESVDKNGNVFYEADSELRDTETVPLDQDIHEYFEREVLQHIPDAWIDESKTLKGYGIYFTKCFFNPVSNMDAENISKEILRQDHRKVSIINNLSQLPESKRYSLSSVNFSNNSRTNEKAVWEQLPNEWQQEKAKWIFAEISSKNFPSEELLAVTQDRGVLPKRLCEENFVSPSDYTGLKLVEQNDFVISLRSFQGGIEFSEYKGIVSPAYTIIRLQEQYNNYLYQRFYRYFFKTEQFIALINTVISGIRDGKNISWYDFRELMLPIPDTSSIEKMIPIFDEADKLNEIYIKESTLVKEFREALINDVVLGKFSVNSKKVTTA